MSHNDANPARSGLSRALILLPLVVTAALGALFYWGLRNNDDTLPSARVGQLAPAFELRPLDDQSESFSTADLRGHVSLVNFWASWCAPCRIEMPFFQELAEAGTVEIYGVNYKDDPLAAQAFLEELGNPFTRLGVDPTGRAGLDWGVYGMPETFVVDAQGRIAYRHVGPLDRQTFEQEILPLVTRLRAEASGA